MNAKFVLVFFDLDLHTDTQKVRFNQAKSKGRGVHNLTTCKKKNK